jgi:hypothetical protein
MSKPTVAILGASADRSKYGNKSVRAHLRAGYEVFPINLKADSIEGLPSYTSLADLPGPVDRISVYLAPPLGVRHLEAIAACGPKEVWLNPGAESNELLAKGRELGLKMIAGCSIVDLGLSPRQFPD